VTSLVAAAGMENHHGIMWDLANTPHKELASCYRIVIGSFDGVAAKRPLQSSLGRSTASLKQIAYRVG